VDDAAKELVYDEEENAVPVKMSFMGHFSAIARFLFQNAAFTIVVAPAVCLILAILGELINAATFVYKKKKIKKEENILTFISSSCISPLFPSPKHVKTAASGLSNFKVEDNVNKIWIRTGGSYYDDTTYRDRVYKGTPTSSVAAIAVPRQGGNMLSSDHVAAFAARLKTTIDATVRESWHFALFVYVLHVFVVVVVVVDILFVILVIRSPTRASLTRSTTCASTPRALTLTRATKSTPSTAFKKGATIGTPPRRTRGVLQSARGASPQQK